MRAAIARASTDGSGTATGKSVNASSIARFARPCARLHPVSASSGPRAASIQMA
ncbi:MULTISPECIES: hypothetical protein [unclassified Duganella]|uniref:hypothetical protein n=1 Tax=unclassified Duganella TaxID=2636909 RepID=UPI0013143DCB|nr:MULTISPECIES: hypothetical protein [unclassified Duganella]